MRAGGNDTFKEYGLSRAEVGSDGILRAFAALLKILKPRLSRAVVAAVTAAYLENTVPDDVRTAREHILEKGAQQVQFRGRTIFGTRRRPDPRIGVELDLTTETDFLLFSSFAPYSINAEAFADGLDKPILSVGDTGYVMSFYGDEELVDQLVDRAGIERAAVKPVP